MKGPTHGKWLKNKVGADQREHVLKVRLTSKEWADLQAAAETDGIEMARIMRSEGMQGVQRRLRRAGLSGFGVAPTLEVPDSNATR